MYPIKYIRSEQNHRRAFQAAVAALKTMRPERTTQLGRKREGEHIIFYTNHPIDGADKTSLECLISACIDLCGKE